MMTKRATEVRRSVNAPETLRLEVPHLHTVDVHRHAMWHRRIGGAIDAGGVNVNVVTARARARHRPWTETIVPP
jgi:hypothetical protein